MGEAGRKHSVCFSFFCKTLKYLGDVKNDHTIYGRKDKIQV